MIFLASFALRGLSQAALVSATFAMLGLLVPPAAWLSGAIIALVTLVHGERQGFIASFAAALGTTVLASLIFQAPQVAWVFVVLIWLPAWLIASILKRTVSLELSLQAFAGVNLLAVLAAYTVYPDIGEFYREPLEQLMQQLTQSGTELTIEQMQQMINWLVAFMPGLFVTSVMFVTMFSLLLARWWQAVLYNPGGFAKEFQSLNLGKVSAMIAAVITAAAISIDSITLMTLLIVVIMLYSVQGLSLIHAIVNSRKINGMWLFVFYLLLFFIPHLMLVLFILALFDPWFDFRNRSTHAQ